MIPNNSIRRYGLNNVRYYQLSFLSRNYRVLEWLYRTAISLTVRKKMGIRAIKAFSSTVIKPVAHSDGRPLNESSGRVESRHITGEYTVLRPMDSGM
jgi:hypothetical protein